MAVNTALWHRVFPALSRFLARNRESSGPVVLDRRHVYILPTLYGLWYGVLLMVMLIGSINYNLSLGYALTFLLASLLITAMLHTYRNLMGLSITSRGAGTAFAGSEAPFHLQLSAATPRLSIRLDARQATPVWLDVDGTQDVRIAVTAPQRGRLKPGRFVLSTVYPLGLFRAWGYCAFNHTALIYPAPDDSSLNPSMAGQTGNNTRASERDGSEDFAGLRAWHPGDSPRHVAWRAAAHTGILATKRFSDNAGNILQLEWEHLSGLDTEARLSRLTRWVLQADQAGLRYSLRLPGCDIPAASGSAQRLRCLEALALFGLAETHA